MSDKPSLRDTMQQKRAQLSAVQAARDAQAVARHFADHPILAFADSCAGYMAMRGEVDVLPIIAFMQRFDRPTALPRITAKDAALTFHRWQAGDALTLHAHGMKEPSAESEVIVPQIILVPLLAFDKAGHRLGYGGGYYDRTMAALRTEVEKPPLFIGVAYSWQEVPELPADAHDAKLDGILTELGVSMFA
jgi:5-formyltetrahydrofolate cyclo-ligase